jgi:L-asparagine oxygenase
MSAPGEMDRPTVKAVTVPAEQRDELMAGLTACKAELAYGDFSHILREVYPRIIGCTPSNVISAIDGLREVEARGYVIIRGLPLDDRVPPTPTAQVGNILDVLPIASALVLCMAKIAGEPYTWAGEYDGSYLTSVLPTPENATAPSSHGAAALPFHTETVHLAPYMPSYVALYCVRSGPSGEARTLLVEGARVLEQCAPGTVDFLRQPLFWVRASKSFGENTMTCGPMSVVSGPPSQPEIRYGGTAMVALNRDAATALAEFERHLAANPVEVELAAGDLLVFDNRKILHGRTGFTPRFDGSDRWLLRSLVISDLWRVRQHLSAYHVLHF